MTLRSQSRQHGATLNDARLAQETAAENGRLSKENADLAAQLQEHKSALLKVRAQKSEDRNTCSITDTREQKAAERTKHTGQRNPDPGSSALAPISTNTSLSSGRAENGDSKSIALETYNSLVTKYNLVFQNWTDIKATRTQLEISLRTEKKKGKQYNEFCELLEKKLVQKRDKIRLLEEKALSLEKEIQALRPLNGAEVAQQNQKTVGAINVEDVESAPPCGIHQSQAITNDITSTIERPALDRAAVTSNGIKFPTSINLEHSNNNDDQSRPDSETAGHDNTESGPPQLDQLNEPESSGLPMVLSGQSSIDPECKDAWPQPIELHHSSSVDDDQGSKSAGQIGSQGVAIKNEPLEDRQSLHDTPIVVEERRIKKRKASKNPVSTTKIKVETISSSPIGLATFSGLDSLESIDLDDIGSKQITPRKQRSLMHKNSVSVPCGSRAERRSGGKGRREAESDNLPDGIPKPGQDLQETPVNRDGPRVDSAPLSWNSGKQVLPRTSSFRATKRRRVTSDLVIDELVEDGENGGPLEQSSSRSEASDSDGRLMRLLENPTPTNRVALNVNFVVPGHESKVSAMSDATFTPARHITSVAPGSKPPASESSPTRSPTQAKVARRVSNDDGSNQGSRRRPQGRIGRLEEAWKPSAEEKLPNMLPNSPSLAQENLQRGTGAPQLPKTAADAARTNPRPSSTKKKGRPHPEAPGSNIDDDPENEQLRYRPLDKLGLRDFKINQQYNNGYDYAFTDVVRNQAERRCLPGCTKPECCGSVFRALAEAAWDPDKPPTASQEEAEMRLLKEFLGDNAHKIRNMTKAEKDETLLQAKTRELANKHGKHRHAYERRRSPPGFWRLDFPSTQEEREDRQKIEQAERDLVAQRYKEAMRPGGAYAFRDE